MVNIQTNTWIKLRSFGLDYDDLPTMMENVNLLLRILTINIYHSTQRISWIFYIMTFVGGLIYLYIDVVSMVWCVFFRYGRTDMTAASVVLSLSSCSCTCITKFVFMKLFSKEIKNTVDKFLKCNSQVTPNTRFAKNLRKSLRVIKRRASIIWIFLMIDGAIFIISPFLVPGRHFPQDLYLFYGLEPMTETPNYEIATFISIIGPCIGIYTVVCSAVYIIVIVGYNEAQMYALSEELRNIWNDSQKFHNHNRHRISDKRQAIHIKEIMINEFIRIQLRDIIKFHIANINLLHELDHEFRPMFAVEYTIKAFSMIVGLLGGLENTYFALPFITIQVIMDCLTGQRLIDACHAFETSLYTCQWENFNASNQKTVLLMLMMSQKTLTLSAGGIVQLNFNFMMIILRCTYSTYTLNSVVKK